MTPHLGNEWCLGESLIRSMVCSFNVFVTKVTIVGFVRITQLKILKEQKELHLSLEIVKFYFNDLTFLTFSYIN